MIFLNVWECFQSFSLRSLVISSVTQGPRVSSRLILSLPLTIVSQTLRLRVSCSSLQWLYCGFLGVKLDKGNISHIHIFVKSKERRDKSQGHSHISLWRIICMLNMHINYTYVFKNNNKLKTLLWNTPNLFYSFILSWMAFKQLSL